MMVRSRAFLSLTALVAQNVSLLAMLKLARGYSVHVAILTAEAIKLALSALMLVRTLGLDRVAWRELLESERDRGLWLRSSVPSILYVFQNNLLYAAISRLDTFSFQISYQTKTLTTAFFSVSMLNQRISARQWLSLVLLTIGVVLVQVPEWTKSQSSVFRLQRAVTPQTPNAFVEQGEVVLDSSIENSYQMKTSPYGHESGAQIAVLRPSGRDQEKQEPESSKFSLSWKGQEHETSKDQGHYNYVIGITCVSIAAIISGFAGVYLERLVKETDSRKWSPRMSSPLSRSAYRQISSPVVLCNLYLSMYGTGFSGFLCARDWWMGKFEDWAMFHGFTSWTWGIVLNQAVGGLLVGYVIRHTDNVVKSFASSCSIVGASLISIIIFDTTPDPLMLLGGVFVLLSSHMYATSRSPPIDERKLAV